MYSRVHSSSVDRGGGKGARAQDQNNEIANSNFCHALLSFWTFARISSSMDAGNSSFWPASSAKMKRESAKRQKRERRREKRRANKLSAASGASGGGGGEMLRAKQGGSSSATATPVMQSTAADNEDCGFVLVEADAAMDVATSPAPSPSASPSGSSGHASGYCSVTPGSASPASAPPAHGTAWLGPQSALGADSTYDFCHDA